MFSMHVSEYISLPPIFFRLYIHIYLLLYLLSLRPDVWKRAGQKGHPPPETNTQLAAARDTKEEAPQVLTMGKNKHER